MVNFQMVSFLSSQYPALRTRSAQHLFEALSAVDELEYNSEGMQRVLDLLSETPWVSTELGNEQKTREVKIEIEKILKEIYEPKS